MTRMRARVETVGQPLYRVAVVLLNGTTAAERVVRQTLDGITQAEPTVADALPRLLRICEEQLDEPEDAAAAIAEPSPLAVLLQLPARARRLCTLMLVGMTTAELAAVCGWTLTETQAQQAKAMRQLALLQGQPVSDAADGFGMDALAAAFAELAMPQETVTAMAAQLAASVPDADAQPVKIEIRSSGTVKAVMRTESSERPAAPALQTEHKRLEVPVWVAVTALLVLVAVGTVLGVLVWETRQQLQAVQSSAADGTTRSQASADNDSLPASPYLNLFAAKEQALSAAGQTAQDVTFLKTKLHLNANPVQYEVVFLTKDGRQMAYLLNARTGAVLEQRTTASELSLDTDAFLPLAEVRQLALDCANLSDAFFTKETLDDDNAVYSYKLEFSDAAGRTYSVQIHAVSGAILKYEVQDPPVTDSTDFVSWEYARQQALARAGGLSPEQVTFTKEKLDGAAYLLCFTLEDGTQYTVELNARTGMANTVDVVPVSADTSGFLGMCAAKQFALAKAGLSAADDVTFTKAKIDRDHAAYVYELEFETDTDDYEVSVHAVTGEIVQYRAGFH